MKLGYNKQLGVAKFVCYNQEFIITRVVYGIMHRFGTKKFVHYKREFVITEFVIAEFNCIFYLIDYEVDSCTFYLFLMNRNVSKLLFKAKHVTKKE